MRYISSKFRNFLISSFYLRYFRTWMKYKLTNSFFIIFSPLDLTYLILSWTEEWITFKKYLGASNNKLSSELNSILENEISETLKNSWIYYKNWNMKVKDFLYLNNQLQNLYKKQQFQLEFQLNKFLIH